ncbi:inositol monophosphatase family protein [Nocardia sp. NPDC049190]|uniref:inositol monophosphatase family protein n=1 Tax=Nocardia sp. NPDC049190 TaxID=3155650 RepID=UPI0033CDF3F3
MERTLSQILEAKTPDIRFVGEESTQELDLGQRVSGLAWVLDPIDGTSNFIHGIPLCAVSLALLQDGSPIMGVINAPFLGLEYFAMQRRGAFANEKPITTGRGEQLHNSIVSIGDYAVGANARYKNAQRISLTSALAANVERVRMFGSAALDLAWVAEGRTDGCIIMSNNPWDTAAGVLIARESGAIVTDSDGSDHTAHARHTIAANPAISRQLVRLIASVENEHHGRNGLDSQSEH